MRFRTIIGQPRATEALSRALDSGRLTPSLIFHGPAGVGKLATALVLCRNLLCSSSDAIPCGSCASCRRIDERAMRHPDVRVVFPEKLSEFKKEGTWREGSTGIDLQELQAEAIRNPVWAVLIDRIRQGRAFLQRRPSEGRRSILIIDQAHRMGPGAANALLKTLEEPQDHAVLVLLTHSLHALLPTIRSRCQALGFQLVAPAEIARFLAAVDAVPRDEIDLRASLSGGRIGAALDLDVDAFRTRREVLLCVLESLVDGGNSGMAIARAEEIATKGNALEDDLRILMALLRDLMILGATEGSPAGVVNPDLVDRLQRLASLARGRLPGLVEQLDSTIAGIARMGNRQLLVENFLLGVVTPDEVHAPTRSV
jgi:DNA polymerase-3 subunit delta'